MIFKFSTTQKERTRMSLLHTAFGSGLNRSARRHLSRLANKFTANAVEIHLKASEAADIRKLLTSYRTYLETQGTAEEGLDQRLAAQVDLGEVIERLPA